MMVIIKQAIDECVRYGMNSMKPKKSTWNIKGEGLSIYLTMSWLMIVRMTLRIFWSRRRRRRVPVSGCHDRWHWWERKDAIRREQRHRWEPGSRPITTLFLFRHAALFIILTHQPNSSLSVPPLTNPALSTSIPHNHNKQQHIIK